MADPEPTEIPVNAKFIYNKPEKYDTHYVNGVLGGLTARGEVILNFFFEYSDVPKEEEDVLVNGRLTPKKATTTSPPEVQRDIKACIIMTPEHAEGVAKFILGLIEYHNDQVGTSDKQENKYA